METFIARQPIFNKNSEVYGYELLYRNSSSNQFSGIDDDQATAELIYNSFLVFGIDALTDGAVAFINFSKKLLESDLPLLLPKNNVVVEILERDDTTQGTLDACSRIRELGYTLAVDDFVFEDKYISLLDVANLVKVEFPSVDRRLQMKLIEKYHHNLKFLAEKIETREEFEWAVAAGYDYFQGYFFSKPVMLQSKEIPTINHRYFDIIEELNAPEPSYDKIAKIIQSDIGLTYKILKLVNSAYFGKRAKITLIPQALSYLGLKHIKEWISLMMIKDYQRVENTEVIKLSLIRAKLMDALAKELDFEPPYQDYFFTGMFSFIDVLMGRSMDEIVTTLPFSNLVQQALLGEENSYRCLLNSIISYEAGKLDEQDEESPLLKIGAKRYMELYMDALRWAKSLDF